MVDRADAIAVKDSFDVKRGSMESYMRPSPLYQGSKRKLGQGPRNNTMYFYDQLKGAAQANGDLGLGRGDIEPERDDSPQANKGQQFNRTQ